MESKIKTVITIIFLALIAITHAHAIVIRHDVDDTKYQEFGEQYSKSVAYIRGCAATLIDQNWLLTAAHCIDNEGRNLITAQHLDAKYRVEKVIIHPKFNGPQAMRYDIALIQLKDPILDGKPALLYTQKKEAGKNVVFVGRGTFGNGRDGLIQHDRKQRGATNTVITATKRHLIFIFNTPETATELEGISGPADSGGPAFLELDNKLYVVGVSSYQRGNGFKEAHYGVKEYYGRVSSHHHWLRTTIDNTQPPAPAPKHPLIDAIKNNEAPEPTNVDIKNIIDNESIMEEAFYQSITLNRIDHAKALIEQGVDIREIFINGKSLFYFSLTENRKDYFLMLQDTAADYENIHHPSSAVLPLFISAFRKDPNLLDGVALLIKQGANIDAQTAIGDTALIAAAWRTDNLNLIKLLVSYGADVNISNYDGNTPTMDAAFLGKVEILRYLLNNGADVTLRNRNKQTALDLAKSKNQEQAIELLLAAGSLKK